MNQSIIPNTKEGDLAALERVILLVSQYQSGSTFGATIDLTQLKQEIAQTSSAGHYPGDRRSCLAHAADSKGAESVHSDHASEPPASEIFFTLTDANTALTNSRSKRFRSEDEAIASANKRFTDQLSAYAPGYPIRGNDLAKGIFLMKAIKKIVPQIIEIPTIVTEVK